MAWGVEGMPWEEGEGSREVATAYKCSAVCHLHPALEDDVPGHPVEYASAVTGRTFSSSHSGAVRGEKIVFETNRPLPFRYQNIQIGSKTERVSNCTIFNQKMINV